MSITLSATITESRLCKGAEEVGPRTALFISCTKICPGNHRTETFQWQLSFKFAQNCANHVSGWLAK